MAAKPPDDHRWGLATIAPSPREGIGVTGRRPGPGLNQARAWDVAQTSPP
ncbi:MAG: hypothetical protein QXQ57_06960 [Sulfolobales archaeon]